ncbi:MAG: thiamine phosphate synthase [Betaproteobacteria bacterium]
MKGLYAITPDEPSTEALLRMVSAALKGGITVLQYRNKLADTGLRRQQAEALLGLTRSRGVPLIVNDDAALAAQIDADGAHVGRDDGAVAAARRLLPGKLLGASCYGSLDAARAALAEGADYVAFGSVFASVTKPAATRAPLELFGAARNLGVPLVAIGGITMDNAAAVITAGADCVAVISDLFGAADVAARAQAYRRLFEKENA